MIRYKADLPCLADVSLGNLQVLISALTVSGCTSSERGAEEKAGFDLNLSHHGTALPAGQMRTAVVSMETDYCEKGQPFAAFRSCSANNLRYNLKLNALHHTPQFYFFLSCFIFYIESLKGHARASNAKFTPNCILQVHGSHIYSYIITGSLHLCDCRSRYLTLQLNFTLKLRLQMY